MFRIELFVFGGEFASPPLMLHEAAGTSGLGWIFRIFMNGIALGQITPGSIVDIAAFCWLHDI
jgi:chromate transporter